MWNRYGQQVKECVLNSYETREVTRCSFDVLHP